MSLRIYSGRLLSVPGIDAWENFNVFEAQTNPRIFSLALIERIKVVLGTSYITGQGYASTHINMSKFVQLHILKECFHLLSTRTNQISAKKLFILKMQISTVMTGT